MERTVQTKFYTFSQNNSGGDFYINKDVGIAEYVIIEAQTADEANDKFRDLGDKCDYGFHSYCSCCGERWYDVDEYEAYDEPSVYGGSVKSALEGSYGMRKNAYIHYYDGKVEGVSA